MGIDLNEFRECFFVEAAEHLDAMEAALLQLDSSPTDVELLNTIFRAAHTIKGGSGTFGMQGISRFTHVLENLLDRLRDGALAVSQPLIELLFDSIDVIQGLIQAEREGGSPPENLNIVLASLNSVNGTPASESSTLEPHTTTANTTTAQTSSAQITPVSKANAGQRFAIEFVPSANFFRSGQDPLLLIRELSEIGVIEHSILNTQNLPRLNDIDAEECYVSWHIELQTSASEQVIRGVFAFAEDDCRLSIKPLGSLPVEGVQSAPSAPICAAENSKTLTGQPAPAANATANSIATTNSIATVAAAGSEKPKTAATRTAAALDNETVRVDRGRLDELINQIGELVIGVSMVEREVLAINAGAQSAAMMQLGKIVRDLQELSLSLRMVPIAATFQKMARVVHDISRKLGKQIDFITEGDDTELDKSVVDKIGDPLIHMVRNAADHGIELPDVRLACGKPAAGKVVLRAYQQGGNIFIELSDDGRGLNRQAIQAKAIERGIISESDNLSDTDICNLIFQPGFSTAKEITDISGRGVGMDVVRRNVEDLQGSVQVRSVDGQGSTMTVRLPLTLAILDGLLVQVGQEVYVIPLLSVIESISIRHNDVRQLVGSGDIIMLRGEVIPVLSLKALLQSHNDSADSGPRLLVIVEDQGRRFALLVDELVGQQQVVIKNLEANFRKIQGVAGATILGDGCVALILDVTGVASMHIERIQHRDALTTTSKSSQ